MNKHFEDTRYYLKRAGETAKRGIEEELEPLEKRFQELRGADEDEDDEPELSRVDKLRADLEALEKRAEGEAKKAIGDARSKLREYREERAA